MHRNLARLFFLAAFLPATAFGAQATPSSPPAFYDIQTEYIFGFTNGSDIGNEGEKAFELETGGDFQKRSGRYAAIEQELEFEGVPSQFFAYELSAHAMAHSIGNVEGLDDLNQVAFSGLSAKLKYLLVGRGPGAPVGIAVSAEPEWSRIDGTDGTVTRDFSSEFRLSADTALIANRLYAAANLIYAPEIAKGAADATWQRSSLAGLALAFAYRVTPTVTLGAEAEQDWTYDGLAFDSFAGQALFVGPTLQVQVRPRILLAAAFSAQVMGHAAGDARALDLTNFTKYQSNLKLEFEF